MILITMLSTGKGSWNQVADLLSHEEWDRIIIVTDDFGKRHFSMSSDKIFLIDVNFEKDLKELSDDIFKGIKKYVNDFSVGLNVFSGNGKAHMALFSALIKLGVGIELVYSKSGKIKILDSGRL